MIIAFLLVMAGSARAEYTRWQVGTGNWSDGNNWHHGEPTSDHVATIDNGGTIQITQAGERCEYLRIGCYSTSSGKVEMSSGDLLTTPLYREVIVAEAGRATFTQTGGLNSTRILYLGRMPQGEGTYNLSGDGELSTTYQYIGSSGTGTFNHSGGANWTLRLTLGLLSGSDGTYNLSETGELSVVQDEYIGKSGTGTFNHSGGTNTVEGTLYLALEAGSIGTYALSGGTLSAGTIEFGAGIGAFNFNTGCLSVGTFEGDLYNYGGTLAPGSPGGPHPRFTCIKGNYEQQSTGVLEIELGGTDPLTQYDVLTVFEALTLNGTLNVVLVDGFNPQVGDEFLILYFNPDQFAGSFEAIYLPDLPEGLFWDTTQLYTTGWISVQRTRPSLNLLSPIGGETLVMGTGYPITWESSGTTSDVTIKYTTNNGHTWRQVDPPNIGNSGIYKWLVPSVASRKCRVWIGDPANPGVADRSHTLFRITEKRFFPR